MKIKYYFLGILLFLLIYFQIKVEPLSEFNTDNSPYSIILTKKISFFTYYPKIILVEKTQKTQVCSTVLPYGYDEDFEIIEDIKSIEWETQNRFKINLKKEGRIFRHTKKDHLIFNTECKEL